MPGLRIHHPDDPREELLDFAGWVRRHGNDAVGRCPVCGGNAKPWAVAAPGTNSHLHHFPGAQCATSEARHDPFRLLGPAPAPDLEAARRLREEVRWHCREFFRSCSALVPGLTYDEFADLLGTATGRRVWDYRGLTYGILPYVIVSLARRFEARGQARPRAMYFAFPREAQRLADLWTDPRVPRVLWRIYAPDGEVERVRVVVDRPVAHEEARWTDDLRRRIDRAFPPP